MKRRDFIKAFTAVSASVPLATALAKTKGAEGVIETFTTDEMENEIYNQSSILAKDVNTYYLEPILMGDRIQEIVLKNDEVETYIYKASFVCQLETPVSKDYALYLDMVKFNNGNLESNSIFVSTINNMINSISFFDFPLADYGNRIPAIVLKRI